MSNQPNQFELPAGLKEQIDAVALQDYPERETTTDNLRSLRRDRVLDLTEGAQMALAFIAGQQPIQYDLLDKDKIVASSISVSSYKAKIDNGDIKWCQEKGYRFRPLYVAPVHQEQQQPISEHNWENVPEAQSAADVLWPGSTIADMRERVAFMKGWAAYKQKQPIPDEDLMKKMEGVVYSSLLLDKSKEYIEGSACIDGRKETSTKCAEIATQHSQALKEENERLKKENDNLKQWLEYANRNSGRLYDALSVIAKARSTTVSQIVDEALNQSTNER